MASIRGERFHVDLSSEDEDSQPSATPSASQTSQLFGDFVKDVLEKPTSATPRPPSPRVKQTATGFPAHKKRTVSKSKLSRQQGEGQAGPVSAPDAATVPSQPAGPQSVERQQIDQENRDRLSNMSSAEIDRERKELLESLDPALVDRLMKRVNIGNDSDPHDFPGAPGLEAAPVGKERAKASKRVAFDVPKDAVDSQLPERNLAHEAVGSDPTAPKPSIHFPKPDVRPELDPADPDFFNHLHEKYFPSLPADPSKLAWMADSDDQKSDSPYSIFSESFEVTELRFSFRGALIPPSTASTIPVTVGLHHHGDAPNAAGYTIPELAHLSRSSFATQRCIAFQILGRVLYRLGRGQFGVIGGEGDVIAGGLWHCLEKGRVLETLQAEASKEGGHVSAKAYATEALWLWQKGGGKKAKAT